MSKFYERHPHRVQMTHLGRTIEGTVRDLKVRGMFSVSMFLVDWDDFGPVWEMPETLTVVPEAAGK